MKKFSNAKELMRHLDRCPAAKTMLPIAIKIWASQDQTGHPAARLIQALRKNAYLIERYVSAVAYDLDSFKRAEIHLELCQKMGLDHKVFRPFEASDITSLPTYEEAERILWGALGAELFELVKDHD